MNKNIMILIGIGVVAFLGFTIATSLEAPADTDAENETAATENAENTANDTGDTVSVSTDTAAEADSSVASNPVVATPATPAPAVRNSVVLSQNEAGMRMNVAFASLAEAGYIALYLVNSQGDVKLIGNSDLLPAGAYSNITIQAAAPIAEDQSIFAVLYEQTAGIGFDPENRDAVLLDANGSFASDIDVIGQSSTEEAIEILNQLEELLEQVAG